MPPVLLNRYPDELSPVEQRWHTALVEAVNNLLTRVQIGDGSPEGIVTAPQGMVYLRRDGGAGTTVYYKSSGGIAVPTNTGWLPLA